MFIMYPLSMNNYCESVPHKQRPERKILLSQEVQDIDCEAAAGSV